MRFATLGLAKKIRVEVLDQAENRMYNSDFRDGGLLDWNTKRMSIEELGEYVARERHLPNVPGASEIAEKGLDLGSFQMRLLEKIEEQARRIRELERQLANLGGERK